LFGALLGTVAVVGMAAAGASGDVGQAALAAAASSASDPTGAAIVSAIQTGTAPMAAANSAAGYSGSTGGGGSCDEALRRVDQQLADANPRISNNIERMEATMWALMEQLAILRGQCPNDEPYRSMIQQHDASLNATISACNGTTTKASCVAQLPTGQPSLASQAYTASESAPTEPNYNSSSSPSVRKKRDCSPVCAGS
jgi:hypothetical protein